MESSSQYLWKKGEDYFRINNSLSVYDIIEVEGKYIITYGKILKKFKRGEGINKTQSHLEISPGYGELHIVSFDRKDNFSWRANVLWNISSKIGKLFSLPLLLDINRDGKMDIIIAEEKLVLKYEHITDMNLLGFLNYGSYFLKKELWRDSNYYIHTMLGKDMDNDGDTDIITLGFDAFKRKGALVCLSHENQHKFTKKCSLEIGDDIYTGLFIDDKKLLIVGEDDGKGFIALVEITKPFNITIVNVIRFDFVTIQAKKIRGKDSILIFGFTPNVINFSLVSQNNSIEFNIISVKRYNITVISTIEICDIDSDNREEIILAGLSEKGQPKILVFRDNLEHPICSYLWEERNYIFSMECAEINGKSTLFVGMEGKIYPMTLDFVCNKNKTEV